MAKRTTTRELETVRNVTQATASAVLGFRSTGSLRSLDDAPRLENGRYDLRALVPWYVDRQVEKAAAASGSDPMMAAGDSPALERYRNARAALAEMELDAKRKDTHPTEFIAHVLKQWASVWRRLGERLARRYAKPIRDDIARDWKDAAEECRKIAKQLTSDE